MHKYLKNPNKSYNSIAKELQIHAYTVSCVIQRFSQTKLIKHKSGCGRKESFQNKNLLMVSRLTQASHLD